MRDLLANTKRLWYSVYKGKQPIIDENGDFTGEYIESYGEPVAFRANISPAKGSSEADVFGASITYSKTISTANMNLPIDEYSLIFDKEPERKEDDTVDFEKAQYEVVAVARGLYHVKYAIKKLHEDINFYE